MAKITKKIRLQEYDVLNNEFKITFQLADYDNGPKLTCAFDRQGCINLSGDAVDYLNIMGILTVCQIEIVDELRSWVEKSRKSLGGLSHRHVIQSRFEVTERLEQERRGKAEAEWIIAAAPPLDWAMSITEELDEPCDNTPWNQSFKFIVPEHGDIAPQEWDSECSSSVETRTFTAPNGSQVTQFYENGVLTDEIADIAYFEGARPQWTGGTYFSTPLDDNGPAVKALELSVEATKERITEMEAAGFGEEAVEPSSLIHPKLAKKLAKMKADYELVQQVQAAEPLPEPSNFEDLLEKFKDLVGEHYEPLSWPAQKTFKDHQREVDEIEAARRAILDHVEAMKQIPAAPVVAPPSLPTGAIGKAVNVIHTHARRFLTPMSLREHDFLRSVIQEEIEKVVGGVL
ncbi:hypothetical protein ACS4RR_020900 [Rhizobium sp. Z1P35]